MDVTGKYLVIYGVVLFFPYATRILQLDSHQASPRFVGKSPLQLLVQLSSNTCHIYVTFGFDRLIDRFID